MRPGRLLAIVICILMTSACSEEPRHADTVAPATRTSSAPSVAFAAPATDTVTAQAVADAQAVGAARGAHTAVALFDRQTGALYSAGDIDEPYASASVMKVFIATRLLAEKRADDPTIRELMWRMITLSDDEATNRLYGIVGAESLIPWITNYYGVSGLAPADRPGWWGLTRITPRSIVTFYAAGAADPVVGPWLMDAMAQTEPYGADGFYQHFGIPSAARSWRVKQGWMCCLEGLTRMHSTGYVDNDRYTVALFLAGPPSLYHEGDGAATLTAMARALLPDGTVPTAA